MRYIIAPSQFHKLIYLYLEDLFDKKDFRKEINPYVTDGSTWSIHLYDNTGREAIVYYWFGPGEYDDGEPHNGVGNLHIHPDIVDTLRSMFSVRESRVLDIIADWVSETLDVDIDEISIYPNRKTPPVY